MHIKKYSIILILLVLNLGVAYPQEKRTEVCIDFRVNSCAIDSTFSDNAAMVDKLESLIQDVRQDSTISIVRVSLCGTASPDGSYEINYQLAQSRLAALEDLIRNELEIPDSLIEKKDCYIPWPALIEQIENSKHDYKNRVLEILTIEPELVDYYTPNTHVDNRILSLRKIDGGRAWEEMKLLYFASMRRARVVFVTRKNTTPIPLCQEIQDTVVSTQTNSKLAVPEVVARECQWQPNLLLKTNLVGLGMGVTNAAIELDVARHWSVALPIYYSAWDYFTPTSKYRTLAIQPELRYWLSSDNDGLFAAAHLGLAYYNFAFGGDFRYQDHNGNSPAIGAGLGLGYRLAISRDRRCNLEFSIGAGVYSLHYDRFHNTPNTKDGLMIDTIKSTYLGIDQAAISFTYRFGLTRRGGLR